MRLSAILRSETVGEALLLAATVIAFDWANSPLADACFNLRDFRIGPEALHLNLTLGTWAADGLLAIFFFVAGLELKREFVAVLAVISTHLPSALRAFLLTLAVVDDLIAIAIIAVFYPGEMHFQYLALAVLPLLAFASPGWCKNGSAPGTSCCPWRLPPGRWCMPPVSTPRWPVCCWASWFLYYAGTRRPKRSWTGRKV